MNTISKFAILSAVAALMIATTVVVAASDAEALRVTRNNINAFGASNQQNSGDVSSTGSSGDTNGGNACGTCSAADG
jgi:hypothetical protein